MHKLKTVLTIGVAAMLLPSCDDLLSDVYDDPATASEYGFVEACSGSKPGVIYINATDYTTWTYIDFENQRIDSLSVSDDEPLTWDIAIHRYDAKTNGARVIGTSLTDIDQARGWADSDSEEGTVDIWTTKQIVTDMSTMMDGYLSYADSYYNPELSTWLDVDTSTMPPVYTMSNRVYIICLANGKHAAVKLDDYMDNAGVKGYMTIQYIYPL